MKFAIMGTGGVGGYFGARLAAAGEDVHFIARGAHLAAIREHGLKIESAHGDLHIDPAQATDDPATIGPVDYVFFTVKLWDTEAAGAVIGPLMGPETAAISFQNGVIAADVLSGILGAEHVMGGVAAIGAAIAEPGLVRHVGTMAKIMFGELDNRRSQRAGALLAACNAAGFEAENPEDIHKAIWEKFAFFAGLSGATALTRHDIGSVRGDPDTRALLEAAIEESVTLARARGVELGQGFTQSSMAFIDGLPEAMTTSMQRDLMAGNRMELDWLSGGVARMAAAAGVAAPTHSFIATALKLDSMGSAPG